MALTRTDFLSHLLMALLYEEEAVLKEYKSWMAEVDVEDVRDFLSSMVEEAAQHKGEILDIIEELEAQEKEAV